MLNICSIRILYIVSSCFICVYTKIKWFYRTQRHSAENFRCFIYALKNTKMKKIGTPCIFVIHIYLSIYIYIVYIFNKNIVHSGGSTLGYVNRIFLFLYSIFIHCISPTGQIKLQLFRLFLTIQLIYSRLSKGYDDHDAFKLRFRYLRSLHRFLTNNDFMTT